MTPELLGPLTVLVWLVIVLGLALVVVLLVAELARLHTEHRIGVSTHRLRDLQRRGAHAIRIDLRPAPTRPRGRKR